jgi:hypothetical protein
MSVTCDRSVVFSRYSGFLHQENWSPWYNWNIVESGVKHHKPSNQPHFRIQEKIIIKVLWHNNLLLTMKSPVVINSTLVSRFFKINLKTLPISFFEILDTAQISKNIDQTSTWNIDSYHRKQHFILHIW